MLLFLFGLNPNIRHGVRLIIFGSSPLLIPMHCLKPCQKKLDTSQVQKRWMRVSLSFWQKVYCSLSFRFILVRKMLVANLLCKSLNWKTISIVIFVHRKGAQQTVFQSILSWFSSMHSAAQRTYPYKKARLVIVSKIWKNMFKSVSNRLGCYFI